MYKKSPAGETSAAISLVPRRQEAFSFKINIYINTLIRFKKLTHASFYRSTRIKIKNTFVGRNKLRISIACVKAFRVIQSNPRYPPPLYNGHFFSSWRTKNPCIDSCFKTILQRYLFTTATFFGIQGASVPITL